MKSYKVWLGLTCQWAANGLEASDFKLWDHLTTKLNKHCPHCIEGEVCITCKNTGLQLGIYEQLIVHNIELAIAENASTVVN